jgi:hypothetical protein
MMSGPDDDDDEDEEDADDVDVADRSFSTIARLRQSLGLLSPLRVVTNETVGWLFPVQCTCCGGRDTCSCCGCRCCSWLNVSIDRENNRGIGTRGGSKDDERGFDVG